MTYGEFRAFLRDERGLASHEPPPPVHTLLHVSQRSVGYIGLPLSEYRKEDQ